MTRTTFARTVLIIGLHLCLWLSVSVHALSFALPNNDSTLLGSLQDTKTFGGDTLATIGRRYEIGLFELIEANPRLKMDQVFAAGEKIVIPSAFLLPNAAHKGIVINLSELRLYFYVPNTRTVMTFPVGVGRTDWDSPIGETYISRKKADPTWTPTQHILQSSLERGVVLPKQVLPGPENPLGPYALYMPIPAILIHGSNDASGIGRRSSSGCIRLQPEAIESFFDLVPINLNVTFVDQPVKTGWLNNDFYLEVHTPLDETLEQDSTSLNTKMKQAIQNAMVTRAARIDWDLAEKVTIEKRGYPVKIGVGLQPMPQTVATLNPMALAKPTSSKKKTLLKK